MLNKRPALKALLTIATYLLLFMSMGFNLLYFSIILLVSLFLTYALLQNFRSVVYFAVTFFISLLIFFNISNYNYEYPNKHIPDMEGILEGIIISKTQKSDNLTVLDVDGDISNNVFRKIKNERVRVFIFGESDHFSEGDKVFINGKISVPKKAQIPTDFNEIQYLNTLGINFLVSAKTERVKIISKGHKTISRFEKFRNNIKEKIDYHFSESVSPIVKAIILGDKSQINPELKDSYSKTGTAHLLAVSGFHVGIIAFIIFTILGFIRNQWIKFIVFTIILTLFVVLSGLQPSAIRAGAMAIIYLFLKISERNPDGINILSFVVLISIMINPNIINSISFQLSVGAMFGIILFFEVFYNNLKLLFKKENLLSRYIIASLSITFSASLVTSILVAFYFNIFSIIAPIANLIVIPFFSLGAFFSVIAIILTYASNFIAQFYISSTEVFIKLANSLIANISNYRIYYVEDNLALIFAIVTSILSIYILTSNNQKRLVFRLIASAFAITILLNSKVDVKDPVTLIPREQFVAIAINFNDESKYLIFDRKPNQYPFRDKSFEEYILKNNEDREVEIGISGNSGINIIDNLKTEIKIRKVKLSLEYEKEISKLFKEEHIVNKINYD